MNMETQANLTQLTLTWSTSRGQSTYGWNICRLDDKQTGKRYRTCGGGYDMIGTVFGEWLADKYQDRLRAIGHLAGSYYSKVGGYKSHRKPSASLPFGDPDRAYFYGMTRNDDTGRVSLDGACGIETMRGIAEAVGLSVQSLGDKRGRTIGYIVSEKVSEVAA